MFWQRLYNWIWEMTRERFSSDMDPGLLNAAALRQPTDDGPRTFQEFAKRLLGR